MTFQKRLQRVMRRRNMRVADLARWFDEPYTTVREWVLKGRFPSDIERVGQRLEALEQSK
jgi:predicted transcriptional regulator